MKKTIITLAILLTPFVSYGANVFTVTPNPILPLEIGTTYEIVWTPDSPSSEDPATFLVIFREETFVSGMSWGGETFNETITDIACAEGFSFCSDNFDSIDSTSVYTAVMATDTSACTDLTLTECLGTSGVFMGTFSFFSSSAVYSMDTIIETASTTFSTSVGFGWDSVVTYMKTLLLLVVGSGLGLLQVLMPYIIALVIIGAVVYFLYRAFRFFKH